MYEPMVESVIEQVIKHMLNNLLTVKPSLSREKTGSSDFHKIASSCVCVETFFKPNKVIEHLYYELSFKDMGSLQELSFNHFVRRR